MRKRWRLAFVLGVALLAWKSNAQVVNDAFGNYRLTTSGVAPRSFTIGNAFFTPGGSALNVRGDQLGTGNTTGEVFRTVAPSGSNTFWRLFRGATEYGRLFNLNGETSLNPDAVNGAFQLQTNSLSRMRLNNTLSTIINGFPTAPRDGFLLLSTRQDAYTNALSRAPFTRLHLMEDVGTANDPIVYAQQIGYRPWMRNGITFTGNSDQSYIGHKYAATNDNTDFVIQWSDNPAGSPWGVDRMKFVFSSTYTGVTKGMGSIDGMEAIRMWPSSATTVNVGIGDFAPAAVGDPTERVDILDGRLRVRELPDPANQNNALTKVLVVDDAALPSAQRGVVKWRDISTLGGCDWRVEPTNMNVVTAYGAGTCPPDQYRGVGIGLNSISGPPLKAKLEVYLPDLTGTPSPPSTLDGETGIRSNVFKSITSANGMAIDAVALNNSAVAGTGTMTGLRAKGANGKYSYGVDATAQIPSNVGGSATDIIGVRGVGTSYSNATRTVGVYGNNTGTAGGNTWAFWSDAFTFSMGGANWIPSDEQLKTDVEEVANASEMLAQLTPKTYRYNSEAYPFMAFNQGRHYGIMAQDLEQILPEAVREVTRPADLDEDGNEVVAAATFKAVNYEALVPLLIASNKEQQERISRLEEMVASCCSASGKTRTPVVEEELAPGSGTDDRRLLIHPNPMTERTTVNYTIEKGGRIQLLVNSSDGKDLNVLQDATLQPGEYRYDWNTSDLEAGMYYVTLLVEGAPVVKKAVKVAR